MKPTESDIAIATEIINRLMSKGLKYAISYQSDEDDDDDEDMCEDYSYNWDEWRWDNEGFLSENGIKAASGETKVCFIVPELKNWVIKVGFLRKTSRYYSKYHLDMDFCKLEADYYAEAEEQEMETYFAATYYAGTVNEVPFFLQEYATIDPTLFENKFNIYGKSLSKYHHSNSSSSSSDSSSSDYNYYGDDLTLEERIKAVFGEDTEELIDFVEEHEINDLHEYNWGTAADGRYIMIDFSGYKG